MAKVSKEERLLKVKALQDELKLLNHSGTKFALDMARKIFVEKRI